MNPEIIHDALTLLPEDLIAETAELRRRKPKASPWTRLLPTAACLALILLGTVKLTQLHTVPKEEAAPMLQSAAFDSCAPAEAAVEETARSAYGAHTGLTARYVPAEDGALEGTVTLISSRDALDAYLAEHKALISDCDRYEESYFAEHQLLILLGEAHSGGYWSLTRVDENHLILTQNDGDGAISRQYTLLELPGGSVSPEDTVTVTQTSKED